MAVGPLPAVPNPAAGMGALTNPLVQLGQAVAQFPQQQEQAEVLQEQRRKNAMERLALLQQQVAGNPQIAQNPSWQTTVKGLYKAAGVPAPLDPTGNIDVNALSPKVKLAEAFAKDPTLLTQAQQMAPETRKAVFGGGAYDTTGISPDFFTAPPQYQLSPYERLFMRKQVATDLQQMASGNMDVDQFFSWVNMNKDSLQILGMNPDQILQENPDVLGKISVSAQAKIEQLKALGILTQDKAQQALAQIGNIHSLEDLRKIQGRYYQARADAIPKQLQLKQYQVLEQVKQRQQALDQGEQRVQQAMRNTDLRSLGLRLQAANQLRVSLEGEKRDYATLLGIAQRYVSSDSAVDPQVLHQLDQMKTRIDADTQMIDQVRHVQGNINGIDTPKVTGTSGGSSMAPPSRLLTDIKSHPGWKPRKRGDQWGAVDAQGVFHPWSP